MKKIIILAVAALLSGCATVPPIPVFGAGPDGKAKTDPKTGKPLPIPEVGEAPSVQMPDLPDSLKARATRLPDLTDGTIKGVQRDGADVDSRYNDLANRHNAVVTAWGCVRTAVNDRDSSKLKDCFTK